MLSKIAQGNSEHVQTFAQRIPLKQLNMDGFKLDKIVRGPFSLHDRDDIDVTCLFFKGIKSERTMDIDPIEMRVEWFKSREIGADEWLKRYRNTCFHEKESLLCVASPHGKVCVPTPNKEICTTSPRTVFPESLPADA